ncbi:universal stress protein [Rhodococcus sp. MEB041]|uniref:universal stress protein n=1 Tax=Rhodococcus sp. MEB041 TaxID=3040323 RepID=UPI0025516FBF|nr:universal stress protein [Rhodococcus sp. MEB041]
MNEYEHSGSIVCGVDGSAAVFDAVRWAVQEALRRDASLTMVHVVTPPVHRDRVFDAPDIGGDHARELLREARATAIDTGRHPRAIGVLVAHGRPDEHLIAASRSARMLILGNNGESATTIVAVGSTLLSVVESARCPVAVVRRYDPARRGAVVIGLDRSGNTTPDRVVAEGFRAAAMRGTELMGLRADTMAGNLVHAAGRADGVSATTSMFDRALDSFRATYPGVRTSSVHAEGGAAVELIALSRSAELLVLGHARGRPCGTTLISVLRHAHCPVLVVPHS